MISAKEQMIRLMIRIGMPMGLRLSEMARVIHRDGKQKKQSASEEGPPNGEVESIHICTHLNWV